MFSEWFDYPEQEQGMNDFIALQTDVVKKIHFTNLGKMQVIVGKEQEEE